jgi:hypothetical protein
MLTLLSLLFLKHLVVDFFLQTPYMYLNKGKYGHSGGILHALTHLAGTGLILVGHFGPAIVLAPIGFLLPLLDGVLHYHIDWLKVTICKKQGWSMNFHEQYWWALGVDQYLHIMSYVLISFLAVSYYE